MLARCKYKNKIKRYGGYLGGFPERARVLLGASEDDAVLHVCGGMAKYYPYKGGFGKYDKTLDLDPLTEPDFLQDARNPYPLEGLGMNYWRAVLADPPYSEVDAAHYNVGSVAYPTPNQILKNSLEVVGVGGRVGIIHYQLPGQPKNAKFIGCVGIICGFNNRIRVFSVFEKTSDLTKI